MLVRKRDNTLEKFHFGKIEKAIESAFDSCKKHIENTKSGSFEDIKKNAVENIIACLNNVYNEESDSTVDVEEIQDNVERCLMSSDYQDVAKSYIIYRYMHKLVRDNQNKLTKSLKKKLLAEDVQNQNANVDEYSFGGRMGEASRLVTKKYALDFCMSRKARRNHENNEIYIHDLDSYAVGMTNCLTSPLDDLLNNGFNTRQTDVRPANSLNTAFQLVAVIFQLQSLQQFGGVSGSHLDWTMVKFFRKSFMKHYINAYIKQSDKFYNSDIINIASEFYKDKNGLERTSLDKFIKDYKNEFFKETGLSEEDFTLDNKDKLDAKLYQSALFDTLNELNQAVEGLYHNLNTLQSRSGNQLPFTSINYGTCTLPEGRLVIQALLQGSIKGVGKFHKTAIFPCSIFQCMKGVNRKEGDPNYDLYKLALKSTSMRIYPNYVNVDWSVNEGYDKNDPRTYTSTMGCRTYNGKDINADEGQNPQIKDGRGNLAPVTVIMPTLAMEAKALLEGTEYTKDDIKKTFMKILDKKISESKDMLLERFEWMCKQSPASAKFMWENNTMLGYKEEEGIRSALKHGTLAIGQLGLAETLQILIGKNHVSEEGMALAKEIEGLFNKRAAEYKNKYKLNFGVYYTPAENLCYTAMKNFKDMYGDVENVTYINLPEKDKHGNIMYDENRKIKFKRHDKCYFTNSIHVPVWEEMTPFEKIDIEAQLVNYSNAGCITYVELPSSTKNNIEALETIVNYAMDNDIPYFAINVPIDTCEDCGYCGDIGDVCPVCGSTHISHLRRVTGYLTGDYKSAFNPGKQEESDDRVKHIKKF
jgi:anaerobic ribonucleoside-triphosphate reductase|nr:MAG TPA: anaerobic ribonucleoside triphosphate reductase [Caudoviricetes sp.]